MINFHILTIPIATAFSKSHLTLVAKLAVASVNQHQLMKH